MSDGKLEARAIRCIFLGYARGVKGYRLWCTEKASSPKIIVSRDVTFDEAAMVNQKQESKVDHAEIDHGAIKQVELEIDYGKTRQEEDEINQPSTSGTTQPEVEQQDEPDDKDAGEEVEPYSIATGRERRQIRKPQRYLNSVACAVDSSDADSIAFALAMADGTFGDEPCTYHDAMDSKESKQWLAAMNEEIESLQKNQTWELVQLPKGKRIVGCKWVFKRKEGIPGIEPPRFKARLVAKGYTQKEGIDFHEVFSPVVKHSSIRILLAIVSTFDLELEQLDVKTAFLHGELEEQIYMSQPEGFIVPNKKDHVCLLNKSLYGLKQSPRQWYKRFDAFMIGTGYKRNQYDNCIYSKELPDGSQIYLLLYVDDMLIAARSKAEISMLKTQLGKEFEMKDLGAARKILGMEIHRERHRGRLCLTQQTYIMKVLQRFNMDQSKPVSTPLAAHFKLSSKECPRTEEEVEHMSCIPYSSAVGSLMYAMVCTRPDLSHAVSVVSRFMSKPGKVHWEAVKWIMRYLRGSTDVCLVFEGQKNRGVVGYVDSDYAGDLDKRRSLTGYIFTVFGCTISWKATLQSTVALSTTEAEYMALTEAVKESIWVQGLLDSFGLNQHVPIVHCDSQSAIHLARNPVYHERTKHIDVRLHFVRESVSNGTVAVQKIATAENPADMMTKPLLIDKFKHCLNLINICRG